MGSCNLSSFRLLLFLLLLLLLLRTVFAPFAVLDDGVLSGKEEAFAVLQGSRYLHRSQDTRALIKESPCSVCGEHSGSCKHSSSSRRNSNSSSSSNSSAMEAEASSLYTVELDEEAIAKDLQHQLQLQLQQQQGEGEGDFAGCRLRLMLQLLPHKDSKCSTIPLLDEVSALLLPTPQETQEAALPPLNFPAVWSDIQDAQRKLTEGYCAAGAAADAAAAEAWGCCCSGVGAAAADSLSLCMLGVSSF